MAGEIKILMEQARNDTQHVTAAMGTEFRCNVDFLGVRAGDSIKAFIGHTIVGKLRNIVSGAPPEPPAPVPWVCQILPDQVKLRADGESLVVVDPLVVITGYNYVDANLPQAYVVDEAGEKLATVQLYTYRSSPYQLELNLQEIDFSMVPARSRIEFEWPNVTGKNAISLILPTEATPTVSPTPQAELVIAAEVVDVYEGPGYDHPKLGIAENGAVYPVTGRNGASTWWQIEYNSRRGWVEAGGVTRNEVPVPVALDIPAPIPTDTNTPRPSETSTITPSPTWTNTPTFTVTPSPTLEACQWSRQFSEENPNQYNCPAGWVAGGLKCTGEYCDNISLLCCPYRTGPDPLAAFNWTHWISEEQPNSYFYNQGFVAGMACDHDYCDKVAMLLLTSPNLQNAGSCIDMPFVSEENSNGMTCPGGKFVSGITCTGEYCDNMSIRCCQYSKP
jgi:hypothetical protein